jgi:hypothetical protein
MIFSFNENQFIIKCMRVLNFLSVSSLMQGGVATCRARAHRIQTKRAHKEVWIVSKACI